MPGSGRRSSRRASTCSAGRSGLIHKHVTGALPIRRNTKDPAYLITLKAYVGTLLHKHDLFFYPEGGRSYSGEIKSPKTGLFSACLSANVPGLVDRAGRGGLRPGPRGSRAGAAARQAAASGRSAASWRRWCATRSAIAAARFVTFGRPIPLDGYDVESRRSVLDLAHLVQREIGRLYKVRADGAAGRGDAPVDRAGRSPRRGSTAILDTLRATGANLAVHTADEVLEAATEPLETRGIIVVEHGAYRVRERTCCATTAQPPTPAGTRRRDALRLRAGARNHESHTVA